MRIIEFETSEELVHAYKELQGQFIKVATSSNKKFFNEHDQLNYIADQVMAEFKENRPSLAKVKILEIPINKVFQLINF